MLLSACSRTADAATAEKRVRRTMTARARQTDGELLTEVRSPPSEGSFIHLQELKDGPALSLSPFKSVAGSALLGGAWQPSDRQLT